MRQFDFYEFAGVIAPGTVILLAAGLIWPDHLGGIQKLDVTLGGLGLAVLLAYVAGHLLQAVGNLLEVVWWKLIGGWPSDWPRTGKSGLLSEAQVAQLQERIRTALGFKDVTLGPSLTSESWHPIFRQIYAMVRAAGRDDRAHTFNGNYGLFRGITSAAIVAAIAMLLIRGWETWPLAAAFLAAAGLAVFRMHRFAKHYARETFVQFLALAPLPVPDDGKGEK
jgi:hypothetical protein